MYTEDPFGRAFCIGWIQAMHKVANPTITMHLPEFLDPLFTFLTDIKVDIQVRCASELEKFLGFIKLDPPNNEAFTVMINHLVVHVQSDHIRLQTVSIHWIRTFAEINGQLLFPYISGILVSISFSTTAFKVKSNRHIKSDFFPQAAILPNLSYEEEKRRSVTENEYKSNLNYH